MINAPLILTSNLPPSLLPPQQVQTKAMSASNWYSWPAIMYTSWVMPPFPWFEPGFHKNQKGRFF